jgi:hypothetical protein
MTNRKNWRVVARPTPNQILFPRPFRDNLKLLGSGSTPRYEVSVQVAMSRIRETGFAKHMD